MKQTHFFCCALMLLFACAEQKTTWNIQEFGAVPNSKNVQTSAIQQTVDACAQAGGGTVVVDGGEYVTGTIILKDHVTLKVQEGSQLTASTNFHDFQSIDPFIDATGQLRGNCLVGAVDATDVAITGKGIIDGRGDQFKHKQYKAYTNAHKEAGDAKKFDRPFLVRFVRTKQVSVKNIFLKQAAAWCLHFYQCDSVLVDGLRIYNHANKNNDGIDFDSSKNATIINCDIDSEDDALCFKTTSPIPTQNVKVRNCRLKSDWGAIKFGTESMGDFRNIHIKDCKIHDTKGGGIKMLSADGANISNITIDGIQMDNVDMPIFVRLGERLRVYRDAPKQQVGSISGVTFSNITAKARQLSESRVNPPSGIFITGTPDYAIEDVTLKNIEISLPGGGKEEDKTIDVPENQTMYPEYTKFSPLPAYGLYVRHIKALTKENITFKLQGEDKREEMIAEK